MKKVSLFFFALALSLSATVVNAQSIRPRVLSEQEMSNINPSSWTVDFKRKLKQHVMKELTIGIYYTTSAQVDYANIAKTLVAPMEREQRDYLKLEFADPVLVASLPPLERPTGKLWPCSQFKYSNFLFALGYCKN